MPKGIAWDGNKRHVRYIIISDQWIVFKLGRASEKSNSFSMSLFSKKLILVLLLKFSGVTTVAWGAERWSPSITYGEIVSKAQAGSPYFQGLLGIYLRSGEAGSKVDASLRNNGPSPLIAKVTHLVLTTWRTWQ